MEESEVASNREGFGRFDRSFAIRTIRDFLIALTIIIVVELGVRLAIAIHEFRGEDHEKTELAAERLAGDVRDIMLNRGGPTAARTVYPILGRGYADAGMEIAIVPSDVTVSSIQKELRFTPSGLAPRWSEGSHHEVSVEVEAEEFCLTCHVDAAVGDVLGTVTVRRYRAARMRLWRHEASVTGVIGMGNVILHTIVLFFLLRLRMEPLLSLRTAVGRLAKGRLTFGERARVRSSDEFGELAVNLNAFLDRVTALLAELDWVLRKVIAVNDRLGQVSVTMREQAGQLQEKAREAMGAAYAINVAECELTEEARGHVERLGTMLVDLSRELSNDSHYIAEILLLEERMQGVAESGQRLLDQVTVVGAEPDGLAEGPE